MQTQQQEEASLVTAPFVREFESFYRLERDRLYRAVCLAVGSYSIASDAVDEAFTRAVDKWDQIGHYDNPAGWVYRVAVNYSISRLRKLGRERLTDELPSRLDTPDHPDVDLSRSIRRLRAKHRQVVVARFLLDWTVEQTAVALDISPGTVKSRLSRALDELRKGLK